MNITVSPPWFIVHTKVNQERLCDDALRRKGMTTYLPMETRRIRHGGQTRVVARPLFSRYLFVRLKQADLSFYEIRKTFGVEWIVSNADKPSEVRADVIDAIRHGEEAGIFDETRPKPKPKFTPGELVEFKKGPFANLPAEIVAAPSDQRIY